jgi:ElaB/YqjD/DUF883 family membrane-anchored ribosome-binding protein
MRNHSNGPKIAERARQLYSSSRQLASEEIDRATSFIRENPVKSVFLGAGLGFLLASLFRSRE